MAFKLALILVLTILFDSILGAAIEESNSTVVDPHAPRSKNSLGRSKFIDDVEKYDNLAPIAEKNPEFWRNAAKASIKARAPKALKNVNKAKNIILFLGDGMSLSTLTAARILKGQRQGQNGEEEALSFEKFPYTGLSKTYCTNAQVPDSACTATAYHCGVKTNIYQIGVNAKVNYNNCSAAMNPANHVSSLAAWAQAAGKSTGIVTTTTITHASPAGAYAHVPNRDWECDNDVRESGNDPYTCMDIAQQLITEKPGVSFDVMLGGGMGKFLPSNARDSFGKAGERQDGRNLLYEWHIRNPDGLLVTDRDQLLALNYSYQLPKKLFGLFESSHLNFHAKANQRRQPSLAEMTEAALTILNRNSKGFFVFIEGGLIDFANHFNQPGISLDETLEFEKAVQKAIDLTSSKDTLIVVTSDHAHPLSISGYPGRGNNILDLNEYGADLRGVKYATLNYAIGPNQYLDENGQRIDLTGKFGAPDFVFPSYIHETIGVHAGDDVGIFASGPFAHAFTGSIEQNLIPHLMAYASCVGDGPTMCDLN